MPATVGVIANPASGRDIRRLVSGASVFDNAEKGRMIYRLLVGLGAVGVEQVLLMPAGAGLGESLERNLRAHHTDPHPPRLPALTTLDMPLHDGPEDSALATRLLVEAGVAAIVVLGGDGTHRVVATHCGDTPLCTLSTGTNNAFPQLREATIAGLATGFLATGQVAPERALRQEARLTVQVEGATPREELALVDVALSTDPWIGSRALWRAEAITEVIVAFAQPGAVGLSGTAALVDPLPRGAGEALYLRLADPATAPLVVHAPLAPGLILPVGVAEWRRIAPGQAVPLTPALGCLALDGEREIELTPADRATVWLRSDGPRTIDVDAVMAHAAAHGLLRAGRLPQAAQGVE
ncbi:MAG: NAD(+)/NADH kinase [Sphaerobacter sp.]|nr:NAD(+)/NADH kinase [Sphaerobacter sp.]